MVKLISTVLIITLIPVLAVGYLTYVNAYQAVYQLTVEDLKYMTHIKAQEINGSLVTSSSLDKVEPIVHEVQERYYQPQGMKGYAYLVDAEGKILIHPDPQTRGQNLSQEKFMQQILKEKVGYVEYDWQGETKVAAFQSLSNGHTIVIGSYLKDLMTPVTKIKRNLQIISVLGAVLALAVGFVVVQQIVRPMSQLVQAMKKAEEGDLTVQVKPKCKDEIGALSEMFNRMMGHFRTMLREVHEVSEQVAASSEELTASAHESAKATEQIAVASQEIARGSESQVDSVQSTIGKINSMNHKVKRITENVLKVNRDSEVATQHAHVGEANLKQVVEQMVSISEKVKRTEQVIRELGEQSSVISGIVNTIHEISQQTNLLSLNAAIEAARAGEHGRGFAVVAQEVRKLAEQSKVSAEEISSLLSHINYEIIQAVGSMGESSLAVGKGKEVVEEATRSFGQIIHAIDDVKLQIEEVTHHAEDIAMGSEDVVTAGELIAQLAEVASADTEEMAAASEQQTATMQEINTASDMLAQMAQQLQEQVNRFKI
ncbi:methyl-accepting chemotaxis protein [Ammoniphilus sp. CFH 90114]|nr:methyl-accepting chemotaxis protein [Ammoniphilus sp. CFH 90114]